MKIIDCWWELKNLGKKTAEIVVSPDDVLCKEIILGVCREFEYVAVKVPMNKIEFNRFLSQLGFLCIEVQMNLSKEFSNFNKVHGEIIYEKIDFEEIKNRSQLKDLFTLFTPGMFSTDRISLDQYFGLEIGRTRYVNWVITEFEKNTSKLAFVRLNSERVGFMMFRVKGIELDLLLNGLFPQWQGKHLGIITPTSPYIYSLKVDNNIKKEVTSISSNNIPVVKLYNRLGFTIESQTYVFVKHNK